MAGPVVLERRDDRRAGALDRRRRVGHDDVVASRRSAPRGCGRRRRSPGRSGRRGPGRRRGRTSRTSPAPTGRARPRRSARPAISADRKVDPIPNATVSADSDSGRRISGRIGMSFASTVSSVIDVPVTHSSSGDDLARLDRRDLVLRLAKIVPPAFRARAPRPGRRRSRASIDPTTIARPTTAAPSRRSRPRGPVDPSRRRQTSTSAVSDVDRAPGRRPRSASRRAGSRRTGSRTSRRSLRRCSPRGACRRSRRPGSGSSPSSADDAGNVKPITIVVGRTTSSTGRRSPRRDSSDAARVERSGVADDEDEAGEREQRDDDLGDGDRADRPADPRPQAA